MTIPFGEPQQFEEDNNRLKSPRLRIWLNRQLRSLAQQQRIQDARALRKEFEILESLIQRPKGSTKHIIKDTLAIDFKPQSCLQQEIYALHKTHVFQDNIAILNIHVFIKRACSITATNQVKICFLWHGWQAHLQKCSQLTAE